mgnify:CR=1 FL=1
MKKSIIVLIGIILLAGCSAMPQKETVIKKIQQFLPGVKELPTNLDNEEILSGHFADPNPALGMGGFTGCDLYLFPDKTYFYLEWGCLSPAYIADKGIWIYKDGRLTLQSDNFFPKKYQHLSGEKNYIPMLLPYEGKDWLLIMGLGREFSYYKKTTTKGDKTQLLICTLGKSETVTNDSKEKLFTKYWQARYSELDELLESNNKTIELNPKDTIAWYIKGDTLYKLQRYKDSIEAFDRAIKLTPGLSDAWYYRAQIYSYQLKDRQNALSNLAQAVRLDAELKEKARKDGYFRELSADEEFNKITFIPGYELREAALEAIEGGRFDEARELSHKALKANPSFKEKLCNVWWNKGWEFERTNRLEEAVVCYSNASECAPKEGFYLFDKAKILDKMGRYDEAIKVYDKIIELGPNQNTQEAWYQKAGVFDKLGKYEEAIQVYDKYLELTPKPNRTWAWCNQGDILSKAGKYDEAIKAYDKAIEIDTEHPCREWYSRARVYSLAKNRKETLDSLAKAANICKKRKEEAREDKTFQWLWGDEEFDRITR